VIPSRAICWASQCRLQNSNRNTVVQPNENAMYFGKDSTGQCQR
jgi:hypothetical protein